MPKLWMLGVRFVAQDPLCHSQEVSRKTGHYVILPERDQHVPTERDEHDRNQYGRLPERDQHVPTERY